MFRVSRLSNRITVKRFRINSGNLPPLFNVTGYINLNLSSQSARADLFSGDRSSRRRYFKGEKNNVKQSARAIPISVAERLVLNYLQSPPRRLSYFSYPRQEGKTLLLRASFQIPKYLTGRIYLSRGEQPL